MKTHRPIATVTAPTWRSMSIAGFLAASFLAPGHVHAQCRTVQWDVKPGWLTTGAWVDADSIVLADAKSFEVVRYDLTGDADSARTSLRLRHTGTVNLGPNAIPLRIEKAESGYLVELAQPAGRIVQLDENFTTVDHIDMVGVQETGDGGDQLDSLFQWAPASDNAVVALGDIRRDGEETTTWEFSFVTVPVTNDEPHFTQHVTRGFRDGLEDYYLMGYPYVASDLEGGTYAVVMDDIPSIVRLDENGYRYELRQPGRMIRTGSLDPEISPLDGAAFFDQVRYASLPTGLFVSGSYVYLLQKATASTEPSERWSLSRFKIRHDKSLVLYPAEQVFLPLAPSTEHVTIIPGDRSWLFVEKAQFRSGAFDTERTWLLNVSEFNTIDWQANIPERLCGAVR